ncbi:hypothetical protein ACT6IE_004757, partial [Escherichia coli]|nr:hypothetical protein [Escherichia coli]
MSGKPAARQGDMTRKGLDIVQGSAGVLIGAPTGVACSVCPNSPIQTDTTRIQTVYQPGSFAPLIRIETDNGEREKAQCRSLAEKIQQEGS